MWWVLTDRTFKPHHQLMRPKIQCLVFVLKARECDLVPPCADKPVLIHFYRSL